MQQIFFTDFPRQNFRARAKTFPVGSSESLIAFADRKPACVEIGYYDEKILIARFCAPCPGIWGYQQWEVSLSH